MVGCHLNRPGGAEYEMRVPLRELRETATSLASTAEIVAASASDSNPASEYEETRDKARAGLTALAADAADAVVLGADTEVVLDGEVFGKPRDAQDAAAMLARLAGRTHEVISALWLVSSRRELAAAG